MTGTVRVGIIGGGLMGRETASAFARWFCLNDMPLKPELCAVCDVSEKALDWFRQIETVSVMTTDYRKLLSHSDLDVVYVAVPHNLHREIYEAVLSSGADLFAEKPFGIDLAAAESILDSIRRTHQFVRCSSEFPFYPGAQRAYQCAKEGKFGRLLEVRAAFLHSSDLDPAKPANWKRQRAACGEIGVMGDLGLHVLHIPLRLGWIPKRVYAQLQQGYKQRPDGKGGTAICDTWDNASLSCDIDILGEDVPMRLEMKRLAPGETNSWLIEILGTEGGVRFSTKDPKALFLFHRGKEQSWERIDLGFQSVFPTITGGIFEPGFPDAFQQMWAAYFVERAGQLGEKFGCATPEEALASHKVFGAALCSHREKRVAEAR